MKIRLLSIPATLFALPLVLATPLAAVESNESNLCMIDTQNPAIRDLAVDAGDVDTYNGLIERNKIGVFFSEQEVKQQSIAHGLWMSLLKPWEDRGDWTFDDFTHSSTGPMVFMNGSRYQALSVSESSGWSFQFTNDLVWQTYSAAAGEQFKSDLNDPSGKV